MTEWLHAPKHVAQSLWADVRYAGRSLARNWRLTTTVVMSLALGIGVNTAIFSLINAVMLRTLPVTAPETLVQLLTRFPDEPHENCCFQWQTYEHFRDQNHVFSEMTAASSSRFQISSEGFDAESLDGEYVVGNFFPMLGLKPAIGRLIGPQEDQPGSPDAAVAVVSWSYWKNRFNLDPAILGKRIFVDGVPATVIGVTRRDFSGLRVDSRRDVWVPVAMAPMIHPGSPSGTSGLGLSIVARLRSGTSVEQARSEMALLNQWRVEEMARTTRNPTAGQFRTEVEPGGAGFSRLRDEYSRTLLLLMAIVSLLLLLACTNVASMLLARATARQREMALRLSLGAGRFRLVRQVLTESLLLSLAGAVVGVLLSFWMTDALVHIISSGRVQFVIQVEPDWRVLLFTAGALLSTGLLSGLAPALHSVASAFPTTLRETGRGGETKWRRLFGKSLVVAQIALSVVLLSGAALFVGHLSKLRNLDVGFQRDSVLLVSLDPSRGGYKGEELSPLYRELLSRLASIPGVRSAAVSLGTPLSGGGVARLVSAEGFQERSEDRKYVAVNRVGPKYFETLGTPLLTGRDFQFEDEGRPCVAIVNQSMARYYFAGGSSIGKHMTFDGANTPCEIVGVAADAKYYELTETAPRTIYLHSFQQKSITSNNLIVRTTVFPTSLTGDVRRTVRDVLKNTPISNVTTLSDQVDATIVPERMIAMLSGLFGALGALLAGIGIYGLLAYTVERRINEIGIRMALGATERGVTGMVLKGALALARTGLIVGAPIALWSNRLATSLIHNLQEGSALPIAFAAVAMIAVALLAAYVPARRAARVDPMEALRHA